MPHIYYVATPGLANRLRALAGYYALAQIQGLDLHINWVINRACDSAFEHLFAPLNLDGLYFVQNSADVPDSSADTVAHYDQSPALPTIWKQHGQDLATEEDFARIALYLLRSLQPTDPLRDRIEHLSVALQIQDRIGVHIRMTDNLNQYGSWAAFGFEQSKVSKLQGFRDYLAQLESERTPVFLATDNAAIETELTSRFKNVACVPKTYDMSSFTDHHRRNNFNGRVSVFSRVAARIYKAMGLPHSHLGWIPDASGNLRTTSMEDAVIDLFLLSRCSSVVATYWSSFGSMGALIGKRNCMIMIDKEIHSHHMISHWNAFRCEK